MSKMPIIGCGSKERIALDCCLKRDDYTIGIYMLLVVCSYCNTYSAQSVTLN